MEEEYNKQYFVTSIYLNSYLLSKEFKIEKIAKLDSGKIAFYYKKSDELFNAIDNYKANKEIGNFVNCYLKVKSIIHLHM